MLYVITPESNSKKLLLKENQKRTNERNESKTNGNR